MTENILIAIAWPYANSEIHVGNITGSHLPGDIVARFHRLKGNRVLMVSGTDSHGTPVTIAADREGKSVEEVYRKYHDGFLNLFQKLGIHYDLFTTTHTENHYKVAQAMFLALKMNGFLFTQKSMQWFSPEANKFLPDRYVEGTCYLCGYEGARSDQCDRCGNVLEPELLLNPKSKVDGSTPELCETEHFYLDLSKLEPDVADFLRRQSGHMRETVLGESLRKIETEGLKPRPITRDLDWGIPVPEPGWEGKRLYVWFEAVIGYLSAAIEWAKINGDVDGWKEWWVNPSARSFYFIGKDNIFFHTALWPAELMGAGSQFLQLFAEENGKLNLPFDVPANQFMNLEGQKISGSRNWAIWGLDALNRHDPDALRYYLTVNMPENHDSDWDWHEYVAKNNGELVATWGNLVNRVLSFACKHWQGEIPTVALDGQGQPALRKEDLAMLTGIEEGFHLVGELLDGVKLRSALQEAFRLASTVNQYLDQMAPWQSIKTNRDSTSLTIYTAIRAIDSLKILFAPFLPFSSEKIHGFLGYGLPLFGQPFCSVEMDSLGEHTVLRLKQEPGVDWKPSEIEPGRKLNPPSPLFRKLEESVVDEERARLGKL
jgi:methionyl-tRNA synthetase